MIEKKNATKAWIDIENSHTKKVITYEVPILKHMDYSETVFDISSLTEEEMSILIKAIDTNPELQYTDIEMFYTDNEPGIPNFGPDFVYKIEEKKLIATYMRDIWRERRMKSGK